MTFKPDLLHRFENRGFAIAVWFCVIVFSSASAILYSCTPDNCMFFSETDTSGFTALITVTTAAPTLSAKQGKNGNQFWRLWFDAVGNRTRYTCLSARGQSKHLANETARIRTSILRS